MSASRPTDVAPLADRLALLQLTRVAMAGVVMAAALTAPGRLDVPVAVLDALAVAYAFATTAVEARRRRHRVRALRTVTVLLLVDGVFVATAVALSGGPTGPLGFLAFLHVIAVTLLVSYRTGLKIAVWHVLLLFAATSLRAAGVVTTAARDDTAALQAVALVLVAAATAAFSALNERQLRRGKVETTALAALAARLQDTRKIGEIRAAVIEHVLDALPFTRAALVLADGSDAVVQEAWTSREPVLVRRLDPATDGRLAVELPGARNVAVLPLVADGEPLGVLALEHASESLPQRTLAVATQFASHAALALRNAVLVAEIETLATTDALTGLANRRVLEDTLRRTVALSRRTGEPCSVVVFDVDRFKSVNDTYGHPVGDAVLRVFGLVLARTVRETDLPARFGGEEFVVVLPATDARGAAVVAERVRAAIAETDSPVPFTVSAGVAALPEHGDDATTLLAAADQALYRSKRRGRDRVSVAARPKVAAT